jgi:hypothetical protein
MINALISGRKTMTRRLAWRDCPKCPGITSCKRCGGSGLVPSPWQKVRPGDRLWVVETWAVDAPLDQVRRENQDAMGPVIGNGPYYRATECAPETLRWRSPIHMPRWASRLTLVVEETRTERLLAGSLGDGDAIKEGLIPVIEDGQQKWRAFDDEPAYIDPTIAFNVLWDRLHGKGAFECNPEVVVIGFRVVKANIDRMERVA